MPKKKKVKPKKKKSGRRVDKTGKAQQTNLFRRKMQEVAIAAGVWDALQLIPEDEIRAILNIRFRALRVIAAEGQVIAPEVLNRTRSVLADWLPDISLPLLPDGPEISLHDYLTAGLTLQSYVEILEDDEYDTAREVKKGFAAFMAADKKMRLYFSAVALRLLASLSRMDTAFYWFFFFPVLKHGNSSVYSSCLKMYTVPPEVKHVRLDGKNRPVYRVGRGIIDQGFGWAKVCPADLKITGVLSEMPLPVYVQAHALVRLRERIDREHEEYLHFYLVDAFEKPEVQTNAAGKTLVTYRIFGKKVGYLVVTVELGIAIIRTFLFLTNNGTPEGQQLHEQLGLVAQEKKYLKIDKLSTFASSDLRGDARLRKLFTDAGCGSLFELTTESAEDHPVGEHADYIAKYFGLR